MAPIIVDPDKVRAFKDAAALDKWYRKNHASADELWIKIAKKDSGIKSVTNAECLDVALSWGWIDSTRKSFDDKVYLQKYAPRTKTSTWSKINIGHVERLRKEGRLQPSGEAEITRAKNDGRWDKAYGDFKGDEFPADLLAAINAEPKAKAMFGTLNQQNYFALAFRTHKMKTEAGRSRKIAEFVDMLKRGETIWPNGKTK
jgi:uncharacterized protein YdeI (YjbR/CyaY-like superfamily)